MPGLATAELSIATRCARCGCPETVMFAPQEPRGTAARDRIAPRRPVHVAAEPAGKRVIHAAPSLRRRTLIGFPRPRVGPGGARIRSPAEALGGNVR